MARPNFFRAAVLAGLAAACAAQPIKARAAAGDLLRTILNPVPQGMPSGFGKSIAAAGNFIVVGAPDFNEDGAIYVYEAFTGQLLDLIQAPIPNPTDPEINPPGFSVEFGAAVAASFDGKDLTILVGAPKEFVTYFTGDQVVADGAAYIIRGGKFVFRLLSPDNFSGGNLSEFGSVVALADGRAYVSETHDTFSNPGSNSNAVSVFDAASGALIHSIVTPPSSTGLGFGKAIAPSGGNVLIGAPFYSPSGFNFTGRAYVYDSAGSLARTIDYPLAAEDSIFFGTSVAWAAGRAFVGAPRLFVPGGAVFGFDGAGALVLTLSHPNPSGVLFGERMAGFGDQVIVGRQGIFGEAPLVYSFNAAANGQSNTPALTFTQPLNDGGQFSGFGTALAALADGSPVISAPVHTETISGVSYAGAAHIYQSTGSDLEFVDHAFIVDPDASTFQVSAMAGQGGMSMNFTPRAGGRAIYRIYHRQGTIVAVQLLEADLTCEDVVTAFPFPIELRGLRAIMGGNRGQMGPPGGIDGQGNFAQFGTMMEFDGTAHIEIGQDVYDVDGGQMAGMLPLTIPGILRALAGPAGEKQLPPEFEIEMPFDFTRVVANSSGDFEPIIHAFGTAMLRQQPDPIGPSFQQVLEHILGQRAAAANFDANGDGRIDVADLIMIRLVFFPKMGR